ncbi:hypothetical protein NQZ79_g7138 [Umbelopsis isabellina]|nr:hypothetical protein NQZ79_g7138 [Umbelopsis isabellina]
MYQEVSYDEADNEGDVYEKKDSTTSYRELYDKSKKVKLSRCTLITLALSIAINLVAIILLALTYSIKASGDLGVDPSIFLLNTTSTNHHAFSSSQIGMNHEDQIDALQEKPVNISKTEIDSTEVQINPLPRYLYPGSVVSIDQTEPSQMLGINYNVYLSNKTRSVMEYKTPDTPLTECYVELFIPKENELGNKTVRLLGNTTIDIWLLDHSHYNATKVSWNDKPERKKFLGTSPVHLDSHVKSSLFPCARNATQIVEYSCSNPDCYIEFFQEFTYPMLG